MIILALALLAILAICFAVYIPSRILGALAGYIVAFFCDERT